MSLFAGQLVDVMKALTSNDNLKWNKPFRDAVAGKEFTKAVLTITDGSAVLVLTGPKGVKVTTTIAIRDTGAVETGTALVVS